MYGGVSLHGYGKSDKDTYAIGTRGLVKKDKYKDEDQKESSSKKKKSKKKKKKSSSSSEGNHILSILNINQKFQVYLYVLSIN